MGHRSTRRLGGEFKKAIVQHEYEAIGISWAALEELHEAFSGFDEGRAESGCGLEHWQLLRPLTLSCKKRSTHRGVAGRA